MPHTTETIGFAIPPPIARQVERSAKAEHLTKSEFFRDMVRVYKKYHEQREAFDEALAMKLIRAALAQRYLLVTSPEIVTEFAEALRRTFRWDGPCVNRQLKRITRCAEIISPRQTLNVVPEDPDDDRILECAVGKETLMSLSPETDIYAA